MEQDPDPEQEEEAVEFVSICATTIWHSPQHSKSKNSFSDNSHPKHSLFSEIVLENISNAIKVSLASLLHV
jgi:hypothetical protein